MYISQLHLFLCISGIRPTKHGEEKIISIAYLFTFRDLQQKGGYGLRKPNILMVEVFDKNLVKHALH